MSGSLVNTVISGTKQPEPEVGMEATVCYWSDRSPAKVAEVVRFKSGARKGEVRGVRVRPMNAIRISGSEHDGSAQYRYEDMPDAPLSRLYLRDARGRYQAAGKGAKLSIGRAEKYYDPHF